MLIQWRASSQCWVSMSSPSSGPWSGASGCLISTKGTIRTTDPPCVAELLTPAGVRPAYGLGRGIYTEILEMEESVLARIRQLMAQQSPQTRREVELTNVPVVVAQLERFRVRQGIWAIRVDAHEKKGLVL